MQGASGCIGIYRAKTLYTECPPEKQYLTNSFAEHLELEKKIHMHFGRIVANQNKKARIGTLCILKMLHTGSVCFFRGAPKISRKNGF